MRYINKAVWPGLALLACQVDLTGHYTYNYKKKIKQTEQFDISLHYLVPCLPLPCSNFWHLLVSDSDLLTMTQNLSAQSLLKCFFKLRITSCPPAYIFAPHHREVMSHCKQTIATVSSCMPRQALDATDPSGQEAVSWPGSGAPAP